MKNYILILIRAYFIFLFSGWRDIRIFGLPNLPVNKKNRTLYSCLVTTGDGSIIDVAQWYKENGWL